MESAPAAKPGFEAQEEMLYVRFAGYPVVRELCTHYANEDVLNEENQQQQR
jgi:hypothetical protein